MRIDELLFRNYTEILKRHRLPGTTRFHMCCSLHTDAGNQGEHFMDYIDFCKNYFSATGIPLALLEKNEPLYSSIGAMLSMPSYRTHEIDCSGLHFPCLNNYHPDIEYGMIAVEGTDLLVIAGPNFGIRPTQNLISEYMKELFIPQKKREVIAEFLNTIPQISTLQFVKHLILIHQCINHKSCPLSHFFGEGLPEKAEKSTEEILRPEYDKNDSLLSSYFYELDLYEYVRKGNVSELKQYLSASPINLNTHSLAKTTLRQAKNLFIKTAANTILIGAIPGGVSVDMAYALLDSYTQEAESLSSIREIEILTYNMLIEFCRLAGKNQIPQGISADVFHCMNFIRSHTSAPISVADVAQTIQKSPSYVSKSFQKELGISPGAFISRCKLEEAKSLLTFSQKSLAEISSHLCYSSQGYFQNVFKKQFGMTPMQYRRANRKIN